MADSAIKQRVNSKGIPGCQKKDTDEFIKWVNNKLEELNIAVDIESELPKKRKRKVKKNGWRKVFW